MPATTTATGCPISSSPTSRTTTTRCTRTAPPASSPTAATSTGLAATAGPVSGLGRQARRPRQRRAPRHLHRQRPRLSRSRQAGTRHAVSAAQAGVPERRATLPACDDGRSAAALLIEQSSRGAAFGDYDNDGDIDVLVVNMNDTPDAAAQRHATHAITGSTLRLVGTKSNRDAIGARVTVEAGGRRQTAEVRGDGSYLSHSDMRAHFGLGAAAKVIASRSAGRADWCRTFGHWRSTSSTSCARAQRRRSSLRRPEVTEVFNTEATENTEAFDWTALRAAVNRVQPGSQALQRQGSEACDPGLRSIHVRRPKAGCQSNALIACSGH